jgi:predicted CXXCH cytochrome family protein
MKAGVLVAILGVALLAAGCGDKGAPIYEGDVAPLDPVAVYGECAFCHEAQATQLAAHGGHGSLDVKCQQCHVELEPIPGPGHASLPACADCHPEQQTHHDPAAGTLAECTVCHTPHGSPNLLLIDTVIRTPDGEPAPIEFTNLGGREDGSFASVSDPGSGVCEVCHTSTRYYRSDGGGEPHFTFPCYTCHPHPAGFAPTF